MDETRAALFPGKSMLDDNDELFEMTLARVREPPPKEDPLKKPVRRVRVFKKKTEETAYYPDIDQVLYRLHYDEALRKPRINDKPYKNELRESTRRLERVKRGVPIANVIKEEKKQYPLIQGNYKYKGVGKTITKLSTPPNFSAAKRVDFIMPIQEDPPAILQQRINASEQTILRLKKIISNSDEMTVMYHNEMIEFLNHASERRHRAMKKFCDDAAKNGFEKAHRRAVRAAQKSRLRVLTHYPWWEEFLDFAFKKPVGKNEEHLIEVLSRAEKITATVFIGILQDVRMHVKHNKRCLELLSWINKKAHIVDDQIEALVEDTIIVDQGKTSYTHGFGSKKSLY